MSENLHCQRCSTVFEAVDRNHLFCSQPCQDSTDKSKHCRVCGSEITAFKRTRSCSPECDRQYVMILQRLHPTYMKRNAARQRQKLLDSREEWVWDKVKAKKALCKSAGIPFDLDETDLPALAAVSECPILHIPIEWPTVDLAKSSPGYPNLDRIIPEKGYTRGNVRIISHRANMLKSAATPEEAILLAADARKFLPHDHPWHLQEP